MPADMLVNAERPKGRDDRKTAHLVDGGIKPFPGSRITNSFNFAREVLRSSDMRQAAADADKIKIDNPDHISFFFLDGEKHKKRRASVAGYFTPKAIVSRYNPLMERVMDEMIIQFRKDGKARMEDLTLRLAAAVTIEILGLTETDPIEVTRLLKALMQSNNSFDKRPLYRFYQDVIIGPFRKAAFAKMTADLYLNHIAPAAEARRKAPKDDVISYMVEHGYEPKAMIIEVMTYSGAGVSTTREFMIMAAWQLMDHPEIKERFLNADREGQFAIIEEILRLDPVAGYLYRRTTNEVPQTTDGPLKEGELIAINIRGGNSDPVVVGDNPHELNPDRAKEHKIIGSYLSFGDGPHRCPGSQVALHETRIFLDHILRVPGFKMDTAPKVQWSMATQGYELKDAFISCDKA